MTGIFTPAYSVSKTTGSDGHVTAQTDDDKALLRFNFNREFLARAVDYDLRW
jgi:hypothetical protein